MATVTERLSALLVNRFGIDAAELRAGATFSELDLDSLTLIEFMFVVEKEFGLRFDSQETIAPSDTLDRLAELVATYQKAAADDAAPQSA